jgi:hypothetical protein
LKAHPYLIDSFKAGSGFRLEHLDPREKMFDEKWLQDLLMTHPDLLPTGEIESVFAPLTFIGREVPVTGGRIDLLFLSPYGYPVIVETKLWRNPESRREVVGQVLDFAFALSKWDYEQLDEQINHLAHGAGGTKTTIRSLMKKQLEKFAVDYSEFRENVEKNLSLGRFLVAVVGDKIRSSSRDIFEGLNRYPGLGLELAMIELECFGLERKKTWPLLIVPRIAKKTEIIERSVVEVTIKEEKKPDVSVTQEKAVDETGKRKKIFLTEAGFWEKLKKNAPQSYDLVKKLVEDYRSKSLIEISPGTNGLRFKKVLSDYDRAVGLFFIVTDSSINVRPQGIKLQFESIGLRPGIIDEFGERMKNALNGKFRALIHEVDIQKFNKVVADFVEKIDEQDISQ